MNEALRHYEKVLTAGEFATEEEAWTSFDDAVERFPEVFALHREVRGYYVQPRLLTSGGDTPRIGRILTPRRKLLDAGWTHGPIGVECKTSGKKLGPVIAQAQDYSRAVFCLPHGYNVMLEWIFIWPMEQSTGDIASTMAQHRIGHVCGNRWAPLRFGVAGQTAINVGWDGEVVAKELKMGRKRGSR